MKRLAPPLVLLVLPFLFVLLVLLTAWDSGPPSFSRSRWIEEQRARGAHFSGGVLPAERVPLQTFVDSLATAAPPARAAALYVRISQDILEPDGGAAQPETQAEPFMAINPELDANLLAGYQESRFEDGGARALTYAVSFDAGKHWSEGLVPGLTAASGGSFDRASDPWVTFGPYGRAYYTAIAFNERTPDNVVFVSTSDDGGRTWGPPVAARTDSADFDDKEAIVADTRSDSPFQGRLYACWDTVSTGSPDQPVHLSHSDDDGASFTPRVTVYGQRANVGVVPLVGPGGVVYAVWASFTRADALLLSARSTDGGDTWSEPVVIAEDLPAGVEDSRTSNGLPSAAVDPRTGDLYVVWQDERFSPGVDQIVLSRSTDGGESWSEPQLVSDGPRDAANFTPAIAVNVNGLVGVAYYSLRNDPSRQFLVDEYLAISRDRGRRFGRSLRVTAASWDMRFAAFSRGFFLGDYQGLSAARLTFHPLWIATFNPSRIDPPARQPDAFTRAMKAR